MDTDDSSSSPCMTNTEIVDYVLTDWNLECLKQAALEQRLVRPRGLAWAILLQALPSPQADIVNSLKSHRRFYSDLKSKLSMDPRAVIGDDPLSQSDESVWKQHFCDNELKAVIMQDVVRTFPDELYFRDKDVQDTLVRVLFFWARSHSHVGYRQGMHEIVAPILFELFQDRRFAPKELNKTLKCILDDDYLEHDSYMLYNVVMKGLERFYTTGEVVPTPSGRLPISKTVHNPNEVVRYLDQVREEFLVPLDHEVASHLASCNITMELFGIRWLRLLFGREFTRGEIPHLWGFIFADGPSLPHIHFIIVAMLISLRNTFVRSIRRRARRSVVSFNAPDAIERRVHLCTGASPTCSTATTPSAAAPSSPRCLSARLSIRNSVDLVTGAGRGGCGSGARLRVRGST